MKKIYPAILILLFVISIVAVLVIQYYPNMSSSILSYRQSASTLTYDARPEIFKCSGSSRAPMGLLSFLYRTFYSCSSQPTSCNGCVKGENFKINQEVWFYGEAGTTSGCCKFNLKTFACSVQTGECTQTYDLGNYNYGCGYGWCCFWLYWKFNYGGRWLVQVYLTDLTDGTTLGFNDDVWVEAVCTDECSSGQTRCVGDYKQTCGNYDADTCLEWPATTSGAGNEYCQYGCANGQCKSAPTAPAGTLTLVFIGLAGAVSILGSAAIILLI